MDKDTADKLIIQYTDKLFGFALSKTHNISQAEELASQIILEVYKTLLKRDNILNLNSYIYRIAANVYANFISKTKRCAHLSFDGVMISHEDSFTDTIEKSETYRKLRLEIAYLSKIQREIVILHYFKKKKLDEIASSLSIPFGTVKWHLYAAKNNLKEGMNNMRKTGNLGIQPIRFSIMGHSGSPGRRGDTNYFLKNRLTQNIAYAAYWSPKSITEIAEELNVLPIFIEDEVETLVEYGFLDRVNGNKYLTNIFITEPKKEIVEKEHEIYTEYAKIVCEKYVPFIIDFVKSYDKSRVYVPDNDLNLLLWSVIPFACVKKLHNNREIEDLYSKFSVKRKDGGDYIAFATVETDFDVKFDQDKYETCGPMGRLSTKNYNWWAWQLNTYYDGRKGGWKNCRNADFDYLYEFIKGTLKKEESQIEKFQRLYEKKYLLLENDKVNIICLLDTSKGEDFISSLPDITDELKDVGDELDKEIFRIRKEMYPKHMQELWRIISTNQLTGNEICTRVLEQLVNSGVLTMPNEEQRAGLSTLMFSDVLPK